MKNQRETELIGNNSFPRDEQTMLEQETRAKWETLRPSFLAWAAQHGESPSEFDWIVDNQVEHARVNYQYERAERELYRLSTCQDQIRPKDAASLKALLETNPDEGPMQRYFEDNPKYLVQVITYGRGCCQLSKKRLGAEYVTDFLIPERSSIGIEWHAVEIESPRSKEHWVDGNPAKPLNVAIGQIRDWRQWLRDNLDYARRPKEQNGLGLVGIDDRVQGHIIIGRRHEYPDRFNNFRRDMGDRESIIIHSYDWLIDIALVN